MGGLAHTIETQGIATTQISLIREHTETIKPPRALWVTFPLGRPLGVPNDAMFQKEVLKHALGLLEYSEGPVLEDYPLDAGSMSDHSDSASCPVNFSSRQETLTDEEKKRQSLQAEVDTIRTWYDIALTDTNRTTVGISGMTLEQIVSLFNDFIAEKDIEVPEADVSLADLLRMAAEDLKAYYYEAVSAQPGQSTDAGVLADWFWGETYAASLINDVRKACMHHESSEMKLAASLLLVPRDQLFRFED